MIERKEGLKKLICTCCGGVINRSTMKCEYCGCEFILMNDAPVIRIETFTPRVRDVVTSTHIPEEMMSSYGEDFISYVTQKAANEIARSIMDCMKYETHYDPCNGAYKITASARVILPEDRGEKMWND